MSDANPDEFTRPATEVLQEVIARYPQAANVWEKICEVSLLTLAGLFPSILACLPMNGGVQLQSRLIDPGTPKITVPRPERPLMYLRAAKDYPFLGAVPRKKPLKKKKKGKGKKGKKGSRKMEPMEIEPDFEPEIVAETKEELINPKDRVLTQAQHYFHIVGIDIILDSKGQPKVLELNDRPNFACFVYPFVSASLPCASRSTIFLQGIAALPLAFSQICPSSA